MSNRYGGNPNPYAQQEAPAGQYGAPNAYGNGGYDGNNVEMASLTRNGAGFASADPNAVLNECRDIGQGVDRIDANLNQLRMLQDRSLNETDSSSSGTSRELDNLSADTMSMYRELTERVRKLKSSPEAKSPKNAPQIGRIDRRLKDAIQQYQQVEAAFRRKMQAQMERQYRIVRPDADADEVQAAVEDMSAGGQQVFQQAMMQSSRQGQARAVLNAVQDRHRELQKIEQQMIELAQLFQDMDTLIIQQDAAIIDIEKKGEEVVENLDKGNHEIEVAVETAKKTRRKKWMCLGICVLIVVVIVVIILIWMAVTGKFNHSSSSDNNNNAAKRSAVGFAGDKPISTVYAHSKIVDVGKDFDETSGPLEKLSGTTSGKSIAGRIVVEDVHRSVVTLTAPSGTDYNDVD
ncbi:Protein transport protein SSO2 [Cytospora mali]|uniref:Protein transport protein SSO2 n=1 Tax=Cytospora mali TaxID=578113 RepID=A0A194W2Z1_CYTMA|nr:Protein transport protein SSO2 [Valsa mali]